MKREKIVRTWEYAVTAGRSTLTDFSVLLSPACVQRDAKTTARVIGRDDGGDRWDCGALGDDRKEIGSSATSFV